MTFSLEMFAMKFSSKYFSSVLTGILFSLCSTLSFADQVTAGSTVMLSVTADGTTPFTYQWEKDGNNLVGSTGPTLTIANIQSANVGSYSVMVSNSAGSTTSDISTITIAVAPAIITQPVSQSVAAGVNVTFTVAASGIPSPTFQWRKNGALIPNASTATLTLSTVTASASGTYTVVAANEAGSATSGGAVLTVGQPATAPVFVAQPQNKSVATGSTVIFSASASGTPAPTFQWKKNGSNIVGATSSSYSIVNTTVSNVGSYTVVATNSAGSVTSDAASLSVSSSVAQPNAASYDASTFPSIVLAGTDTNFSYTVTNTGTKTWAGNHYLSLRDSNNQYLAIVTLAGVAPGESKTVSMDFLAPLSSGTYTYYVQAMEAGVEMFSTQASLTLIVNATLPNAIGYNITTFPGEVRAGATVDFSYNVTNLGTKTWGINHYLSLRDNNNNYLSIISLSGVAPGGSKTVTMDFTAPVAPGVYTYYVQAMEAGVELFSTQTTLTLIVKPTLPNAIGFNGTTFPSVVKAGMSVSFNYQASNLGTNAWGSNHYLALRDSNNNYLNIVSLNGVAVGGSESVNLGFNAPLAPGTYTYYVQAMEAGVELFSTQTTFTLVVKATLQNAISYNGTTFPNTIKAGSPVNFTCNVTNLGSEAWNTNHYLSVRDSNNNYLSIVSLNGAAVGTSKTVSMNFIAPPSPGVYIYYVQALENGVEMFSTQTVLTLVVF